MTKTKGAIHVATLGLRRGEGAEITAALDRHNWNISHAALELRIDRKTLHRKIRLLKLEPTAGMPASAILPADPLDNEISLANFRRQCRIWGAKRLFEALDRDWGKYRGIQRVKLIELAVNNGYPRLPQAVDVVVDHATPADRIARIVGMLEMLESREDHGRDDPDVHSPGLTEVAGDGAGRPGVRVEPGDRRDEPV